MNTAVRNIVAGAQTLRFVTAVILSVSVTTAVAGPMAYQAVDARNEAASELGSPAGASRRAAPPSFSLTTPTSRGPGGGPGGGASTPNTTPGSVTVGAVATTGAAAISPATATAGVSTIVANAAERIIDRLPASPAGTPRSPERLAPPSSTAAVPAPPNPPIAVPVPVPPTTASPTTASPTTASSTTAAGGSWIDAFGVKSPCEDKAPELDEQRPGSCAPKQ